MVLAYMEDLAQEDAGMLMEMFKGFGERLSRAIMVMVGSVRDLGLGLDAWDSERERVDGLSVLFDFRIALATSTLADVCTKKIYLYISSFAVTVVSRALASTGLPAV